MSYEQKINDIFISTMSDLGFINIMTMPEQAYHSDSDYIITRMIVTMPYGNEFTCIMHKDLSAEIACNIFGNSSCPSDIAILKDSALEFLNIIAGSIMNEVIPDKLYELGIPAVLDNKNFNPDLSSRIIQNFITLDGKIATLIYKLKN